MTDRIVPKELLDDLSVIGAPMYEYLEGLRLDVGPSDSSFKNQRRTFDLLLPILEVAEIPEPEDLDSPIARRRLLDVLIAEAPKRLDGMLSAGKPDTDRAAVTDETPGTTSTGNPAAAAQPTRSAPGSLTAGVPASDTSATSPKARASISLGNRSTAL